MKKVFKIILVLLLVISLPTTTNAFSFGNIIDKAKDWTENAADDAKDWTENAADDAIDWTKNAAEDVTDTVDKVLKDQPDVKEIDTLPALKLDLNLVKNAQTAATGSFTYGSNVKQKRLSPSAAEGLKRVLMRDNGFSEYWANFVVDQASELGEKPGDAVVGLLPYSEYYGGRIVTAINKAVAEDALTNIDPYRDGIIPVDKLKGMNFSYKVDKVNLNGKFLVVITGVKYGTRDNFTVTVKAGGKQYTAQKKALNSNEIVFVAEVPNGNDLQVIYNSGFKLPKDATVLMHEITADIARKLQKKINDLSPLGDPISNEARGVIDKVIYQGMFKQYEYLAKAKGLISGETVTVNDLFANGDVGVIVTDALKAIPGVDTLLSASGLDSKIASAIRDIVNQAEVRTFAELKNGKIYLKALDTKATDSLNAMEKAKTATPAAPAAPPAQTTPASQAGGASSAGIKVMVNGKYLSSDVQAQNVDGRVLVPVRPIFEALGAQVYWDTSKSIAVGSKQSGEDMTVVKLTINSKTFTKETFSPYVRSNNPLDVPAMIIDGRTMVPARVIGESMGEKVEWDGATGTVIVGSRQQKPSGVVSQPGMKTGVTLTDSSGKVVYEGTTLNGKKHSSGTYFYSDGSTYKGQWFHDQQHGLGTLTYASGDTYVGQWNYGKKHGKGTYTWANGDKYVGTYDSDVRHGYGVMTWASGQVYKGEYVNGKRAN